MMINYVKKLESTTQIKIVPENLKDPWDEDRFIKLSTLLREKFDPKVSSIIRDGYFNAW